MKRIAIVTPGGDAPGMNATIRAVVRKALFNGLEVYGIMRGYAGLIENEFVKLDWKSVSGIMDRGGTFLKTERYENFEDIKNISIGCNNLKKNKINGLVIIGGDGSLHGGFAIHKFSGIGVVGIPASIDNDIYGTDETVGYDTACNTAVSAIDKIKDTETSFERIFVVEVMGKKRGFIALKVGITIGAEAIVIPEVPFNRENFANELIKGRKRGMRRAIVVYAEGVGKRHEFVKYLNKKTGFIVRESILGYIQRGGAPSFRSRMLASLFGAFSVDTLSKNPEKAKMVGIRDDKIVTCELETCILKKKEIDKSLLELQRSISVFKL